MLRLESLAYGQETGPSPDTSTTGTYMGTAFIGATVVGVASVVANIIQLVVNLVLLYEMKR